MKSCSRCYGPAKTQRKNMCRLFATIGRRQSVGVEAHVRLRVTRITAAMSGSNRRSVWLKWPPLSGSKWADVRLKSEECPAHCDTLTTYNCGSTTGTTKELEATASDFSGSIER